MKVQIEFRRNPVSREVEVEVIGGSLQQIADRDYQIYRYVQYAMAGVRAGTRSEGVAPTLECGSEVS